MSKYELSLSKDYVPDWTVVDGIRELFQNALDQETTVEGNDMFFNYDETTQSLSIGNKKSVLNPKTLLLGSSSKRDDDKTIGQFGEGYKIATLVLTRFGKTVKFFNYGAKEVWEPRFVNSRRYGAEILTFFINKKFTWSSVPDNDLTIVVDGITLEEYEEIVRSNLHLSGTNDFIETAHGRILLDPEYRNKVYVNGLFICDYLPYHYGYDFKPEEIKLDRDRKLVSDFNLQYLASKMWLDPKTERLAKIAADLIKIGAADVKFVGDVYTSSPSKQSIAVEAHNEFKKEHGENAVPVSNTYEMSKVSPGYTPVIVEDSYKKMLKLSPDYKEPEVIEIVDFKEKVKDWLMKWESSIPFSASIELDNMIKEDVK